MGESQIKDLANCRGEKGMKNKIRLKRKFFEEIRLADLISILF